MADEKSKGKNEQKPDTDRMLYKAPGRHRIQGCFVDYVVVKDSQVDAMIKDGWCFTVQEAMANIPESSLASEADSGMLEQLKSECDAAVQEAMNAAEAKLALAKEGMDKLSKENEALTKEVEDLKASLKKAEMELKKLKKD